MRLITLKISENTNNNCTVKTEIKDTKTVTDDEKKVGNALYNVITNLLNNMENNMESKEGEK